MEGAFKGEDTDSWPSQAVPSKWHKKNNERSVSMLEQIGLRGVATATSGARYVEREIMKS